MHYWVGVTDRDWFETLRRLQPDEANFWQPSQRAPRAMVSGWPFLFKLHSPRNFVVGGGFFVRYTELPCFLAWAALREKNGASSLGELVQRVARYRRAPQTPGTAIGCNVLTEPFFFDEDEFDGRSLAYVPNRLTDQPGREFLEWHNSEVCLG